MSKAFLREDDAAPDPSVPPRPLAAAAPGVRPCLTPAGAARLREEVRRLTEEERPPLAVAAGEPEGRRALQALDQRVRQLRLILESAEVLERHGPGDVVHFGDLVTVREPDGTTARYRLVGAFEAELVEDGLNSQSPLGRALLNARLGQTVTFEAPRGPSALTVVGIG